MEDHAASVRRYHEDVAQLNAKKGIRDKMLKAEREAFHLRQSQMVQALYLSEVGGAVIKKSQLEAVIARPSAPKVG